MCMCLCVHRCWCAAVLTWFSSWETSSQLSLLFTRNTGTTRESRKAYDHLSNVTFVLYLNVIQVQIPLGDEQKAVYRAWLNTVPLFLDLNIDLRFCLTLKSNHQTVLLGSSFKLTFQCQKDFIKTLQQEILQSIVKSVKQKQPSEQCWYVFTLNTN